MFYISIWWNIFPFLFFFFFLRSILIPKSMMAWKIAASNINKYFLFFVRCLVSLCLIASAIVICVVLKSKCKKKNKQNRKRIFLFAWFSKHRNSNFKTIYFLIYIGFRRTPTNFFRAKCYGAGKCEWIVIYIFFIMNALWHSHQTSPFTIFFFFIFCLIFYENKQKISHFRCWCNQIYYEMRHLIWTHLTV